jgi:hypothetical protein
MTNQPNHPNQVDDQAVSEELVDSFFDRELNEGARDQFFKRLRAELPRCAEVAKTQRMISMLREPTEQRDVSARVLSELSRRQRFLPERLRRMVTTGRLIAAGVGLAAVLGIAIIDREAPGFLRLTPQPRPVGDLVASGSAEARQRMAEIFVPRPGTTPEVSIQTAAEASRVGAAAATAQNRVFRVQTLSAGVTSAKLLPVPASGNNMDSLVVYRGAGPDSRFVLPEAVYIDRNAAIVLPLGHMSPSRTSMKGWAGASSENMFLLPTFDPSVVAAKPVVNKTPTEVGGSAHPQDRAEK